MNLVSAIDSGLAEFGKQNELVLGFEFLELGPDYATKPVVWR